MPLLPRSTCSSMDLNREYGRLILLRPLKWFKIMKWTPKSYVKHPSRVKSLRIALATSS